MADRRKIAVLVETEYIPDEIRDYERVFSSNGFEVQLMSRLWGQPSQTFVSDVTDPNMQLETLTVGIDFENTNLDEYAAVLMAANYVSVRLRYFEGSTDPRSSPAVQFYSRAMRDKRIIKGALCHALWILTPVPEYLAGRKVICHEVVQADVQNAGGIVVHNAANVEVDEDLVTGHSKAEAALLAERVVQQIRWARERESCRPDSSVPAVVVRARRRVLVVLSNWGYWAEELIGPLERFDAAGYQIDFCTPNGSRPNAIPVSKDAFYIDPPLNRSVTSEEMAKKAIEIDDPSTAQGNRLENPINLAAWLPERPYAAAPTYVRCLEAYNRNLTKALERIADYDALLLVGGSGPLVDMVNNGRVHDLILGFSHAGKVVAAECYGVACLAFARSWEDRKSIIWGKHVTGHCLEYDYKDGTGFVKGRNTFLDFNMGPPPYPLEFILRDATGPDGAYIGNFGKEISVIVDYPFVTGRSTPDSYLTGQKVTEVLDAGLRRWGW
jgi:putative intracellular protease/amidase